MRILEISLHASLLILGTLLLRTLLLHKLPKGIFVALWGLAAIRLLLPLRLPSRWSMLAALPQYPSAFVATPFPAVPGSAQPYNATAPLAAAPSAFPTQQIACALWLLGAAALALYFLTIHARCKRIYRRAVPFQHPILDALQPLFPGRRAIPVMVSPCIGSPLTYGLFRPVILLPSTFLHAPAARLELVLKHELAHIRHGDILLKWLFLAALCVHWFNPLVWLLYAFSQRDLELRCDEAVLRSTEGDARRAYAHILLQLEEARAATPTGNSLRSSSIPYLFEHTSKERIRSIMKFKSYKKASYALSGCIVLLLFITLATSPQQGEATSPRIDGDAPAMQLYFPSQSDAYPIYPTGLDDAGRMEAIPEGDAVSCLSLSGTPGESGNVILYGHAAWQGAKGAFASLHTLQPGDPLRIDITASGEAKLFTVSSIAEYPHDALPSHILSTEGEPRLTLLTCTGEYLPDANTSAKRLIVTCLPEV